ncbi:MAG: hypothetical protein Q4P78_07555 [Rothia sp. (in: high G+C Gram-positive bacteria)]|uniref:hypothetical protein n=1 Tax=Rothia sp. (in: high G+C Gram-positive bacteria) TaxID=1885016 RepID=UPI0026E0C742|nr:hypothetical protein [Rothia sp. (in: high G+C Gram-positive bacteria)]MDO5751033.1 hypothetical protein [Rothia sp. (in: high G+C Gram-positive bacteria)]
MTPSIPRAQRAHRVAFLPSLLLCTALGLAGCSPASQPVPSPSASVSASPSISSSPSVSPSVSTSASFEPSQASVSPLPTLATEEPLPSTPSASESATSESTVSESTEPSTVSSPEPEESSAAAQADPAPQESSAPAQSVTIASNGYCPGSASAPVTSKESVIYVDQGPVDCDHALEILKEYFTTPFDPWTGGQGGHKDIQDFHCSMSVRYRNEVTCSTPRNLSGPAFHMETKNAPRIRK